MVDVKFRTKQAMLPLLVDKLGTVNLVGRNCIVPLALMETFKESGINKKLLSNAVCKLSPSNLALEDVLKRHQVEFSEVLGLVKVVKVHLHCCPDAQPKFFKARPVPYALREKVDAEIDRLLKENIIQPITTSEWAAPDVPVLKRNGSVRLCEDFKLTVNQATELEQYPLPRIEDLFAHLAGGQTFIKLDLCDAYCQLQLDEGSRNLVVINTHRGLFRYTVCLLGLPQLRQFSSEKLRKSYKGYQVFHVIWMICW